MTAEQRAAQLADWIMSTDTAKFPPPALLAVVETFLMAERAAACAPLAEIARGRKAHGKPLAAEDARQIARKALVALGVDW